MEDKMKPCYGTIFPDPTKVQFFQPSAGKVFQVQINTLGPGHRNTKLNTDLKEWQDCTQCEEYQTCLDFSMASLAIKEAVARI